MTSCAWSWAKSMRLVLLGIGIGLGIAVAGSRVVASLLFGLAATDAMTMLMAMMVMVTVWVIAAYLPARRAARVDPLVALRDE
jgi:ABC-type antimicrobial peptide transport system permease subunit